MEIMTWSRPTSPVGASPVIVSEYVLNELGIFVKREKRMPKKAKFTALTGFRIGYAAVPGTDYRAAPLDRNAILWYKITRIQETGESCLTISGNRQDTINLCFDPDNREAVQEYIKTMRQQHPIVRAADYDAAAWLCWRDDDDWGDPQLPLTEMIALELETERFIEPELLAETTLIGVRETPASQDSPESQAFTVLNDRPKFCHNCGAALALDGNFCPHCGSPIQPD